MKVGEIMALSLNQITKPQAELLNKSSIIYSIENSARKRPYVEGKTPQLTAKDFSYMLKNLRKIYRLPSSLVRTTKLIKQDLKNGRNSINLNEFVQLQDLLASLGVNTYGFFEVTPEKVFKGYGVPHKYALVLSIPMDKESFKSAPCIECQIEVARVYEQTGTAANTVASFLQGLGFGASPNHSMGGQLDYSMACEWAGIGVVGRHSMAITPQSGPCHRVSVVYVSIENLNAYIRQEPFELEWVKSFCEKCGKCIRSCPTKAILDKPVILEGVCPTSILYDNCSEGFSKYGCGVCIQACPFTVSGYDKIKSMVEIK